MIHIPFIHEKNSIIPYLKNSDLHSGMGGLVGILVGFELRVSGHSLKPTEYEYIVVCFKSYVFMVKNEF